MAGSSPPSGGLGRQPPLSLSSSAWELAGRLLVSPPEPIAADFCRHLPLAELLARLDAAHQETFSAAAVAPPVPLAQRHGSGLDLSSPQPECRDDAIQVLGTDLTAETRSHACRARDRLVARQSAQQLRSPLEASPLPGLALALLQRSWNPVEREQIRFAADALRRRLAGDTVTYVINRNLNSSNICTLHCGFCAFRRDEGQTGAFRLSLEQLCERASEARRLGATELCLQAALDPQARLAGSHLAWAEHLLQRLAAAAPGLHLHAFSPQELLFFAQADGLPLDVVLCRLRRAGLGSVPGTAAEVLSERVRRVICPEKLSARAWVAVMLQLQSHGLAATSTLMAGHVEQPADRVAHLLTLVALQRSAWQHHSRGFSEFVLLPFIGASAPPPLRQRVGRDQPDTEAMLLLTAQARLVLGPWFVHHQPSWVKLTLPQAVEALRWGCDDIGGTLMEEHITTMAGASGGTCQSPQQLRRAVSAIGRPLRQRTTLYGQPASVSEPSSPAEQDSSASRARS